MNTLPNDLLTLVCNLTTTCESKVLYLHTNNKLFECQDLSIDDIVKMVDWRWINEHLLFNPIELFTTAGKFKCNEIIEISEDHYEPFILRGYVIGGHVDEFKSSWAFRSDTYEFLIACCQLAMAYDKFDIVQFCIAESNNYIVDQRKVMSDLFGSCGGAISMQMIEYIYNLKSHGFQCVFNIQKWATKYNKLDVVEYILSHVRGSVRLVMDTAMSYKNLGVFKLCLSYMTENYIEAIVADIIYQAPFNQVDKLKFLIDGSIISKSSVLDLCRKYNRDKVYKYVNNDFKK